MPKPTLTAKPRTDGETDAPPPKKSKSETDFDDIFGEPKKSTEKPDEEEPAAGPIKKKHGYVPPAVGTPSKASLTNADITGVVVGHLAEVKGCVAQYQAKNPGEHGSITMEWTIKGDGKASAANCKTDDYKGSVLDKCLASAIKGWQFPTFSGPPQTVPFPFKF